MTDLVEHTIPDQKSTAMIQECADRLEKAATIPAIKEVISQAQAINEITKHLAVSKRVKNAAFMLLLDAERQLGAITSSIPLGGRKGFETKRKVLKSCDLQPGRIHIAERLAAMPREKIESVAEKIENKSLNGISVELGFIAPRREFMMPEKLARNIGFLANEAIELLERGVSTKKPPHAGTVIEMRGRYMKLTERFRRE